jgi:hypothetical protein
MRAALFIWTLGMAVLAGCEAPVTLGTAPDAVAGCEPPTEDNLGQTARMLPGRLCQSCHIRDGQGAKLTWTASGTVYGSADAKCNEGGIEGVMVELLDEKDRVLLTLTTNRAGNFFTAEPIDAPRYRVPLSTDGKTQEMLGLQPTGACAGCHYPNSGSGAPGRVYIN